MKISRFFGITTREAMRQVRLALGGDALIVSNRRVDGGVEILAADATSVPDTSQAPSRPTAPSPQTVPARPTAPSPQTTPVRPPAAALDAYSAAVQAAYGGSVEAPTRPAPVSDSEQQPPDVMDAIGAMRGALEDRFEELMWGNQLRSAPQAATLFQTLLNLGFSTALLRAMLKRLPEHLTGRAALQWARNELVSHLPVLADESELWKPGLILALVGPTGVGKTTTLAKLAARCVRRFGPDKLVLITTDTYRIGAHEQLKIYGEMLRAPVHVVRSGAELREVVESTRPDQMILIDNVGISQRDRYIAEQASMLAAAGREVSRLLVLNAASHGETLDEVARRYSGDGGTPLKGCIISKVDEASRLGAALDTALRYRFPIHYLSIGQKVPEHLVHPQADELIDQALTQLPAARNLYSPTEADLAALLSLSKASSPSQKAANVNRAQQMAALPRLLALSGGGATRLTPDDLGAGCAYIDELTCAAEAYAVWRRHASGSSSGLLESSTSSESDSDGRSGGADFQAQARHLLRAAQNALATANQTRLLVTHDQVVIPTVGIAGGRSGQAKLPPSHLRASLLLDEQGAPLASPLQQLSLPAGWVSSCGASQVEAPTAADALLKQLEWIGQNAVDTPMVHLFDGGSPALWRELTARPLHWLAQVPAITRLYMEDGSTTAQALAKTLPHQLVADPDYLYALTEVAGGAATDRALWAATTRVRIAVRGHEPFSLSLISLRLVDKASGKEVKRILGLHPGLEFSISKLAAWLVIKNESREAMRHSAAAWKLLMAQNESDALQRHAMVATQVGLAAWQLAKSPLTQEGRQLATAMLGKNKLPTTASAAAMLKLFTLKEMLAA